MADLEDDWAEPTVGLWVGSVSVCLSLGIPADIRSLRAHISLHVMIFYPQLWDQRSPSHRAAAAAVLTLEVSGNGIAAVFMDNKEEHDPSLGVPCLF